MPNSSMYVPLSCDDAIAFVCDSDWGFAEKNADGFYTWVNRAFCEVLNAPVDLVIGTNWADWTHPDDIEVERSMNTKVANGEVPEYTLSKRYIQRGSTPQNPRIVWGLLSVSGKWTNTKFAGYRLAFRVYERPEPQRLDVAGIVSRLRASAQWTVKNWKLLITLAVLGASLTRTGSQQLLDMLRRAKEAKTSVDSVLDSSSSGLLAQPSTESSPGTSPTK